MKKKRNFFLKIDFCCFKAFTLKFSLLLTCFTDECKIVVVHCGRQWITIVIILKYFLIMTMCMGGGGAQGWGRCLFFIYSENDRKL